MTYKGIKYLLCGIVATLCGCSAEQPGGGGSGMGHIHFNISVEADVADFDPSLTLETIDGRYSHTWESASKFPQYESFHVGEYQATAFFGNLGAEGFDCPCYLGTTKFMLEPDKRTAVDIECTLSQALVSIKRSQEFHDCYPGAEITLHSAANDYLEYPQDAETPIYLQPGNTTLYIKIADGDRQVTISPDFTLSTKSGDSYTIEIDYQGTPGNGTLSIQSGELSADLVINKELFTSQSPAIQCIGFTNGETVSMSEGSAPNSTIAMNVIAPNGLKSIILTSICPDVDDAPAPELDLLDPDTDAGKYGLKTYTIGNECHVVDFTNLLQNLATEKTTDVTFMLQAKDPAGRVSELGELKVHITKVEFDVLSITPALLGEDTSTITLEANVPRLDRDDFTVLADNTSGNGETSLKIIGFNPNPSDNTLSITISVPQGNTDIPIKINYMGSTCILTEIPRGVPQYDFNIDAFATTARISVLKASPQITESITRYLRVKANGQEVAILQRDIESGTLWISGLRQATKYEISCEPIPGIAKTKSCVTETEIDVPGGNFEDAEPSIQMKSLPSGGVYSSSSFPIFNRQNYTDIDVRWVKKYWANVNEKTFCKQAGRQNTWYMQPSAALDYENFADGYKSVKISSVGWSLNGEEIAPYQQESNTYTPYSRNIPHIDHRSSGRLFLGRYHFDATTLSEEYIEGVSFNSRPSSLNGYFKYIPDQYLSNDRGYVRVQLVNDVSGAEIVIAENEMDFDFAPDFRAFNLPLKYRVYELKPTKLKIMFCSTNRFGTIKEEDTQVAVTAYPESGTFTGSSLWIDKLSFAY